MQNVTSKFFLYPFIGAPKINAICFWFIFSMIAVTTCQLCVSLSFCLRGSIDIFNIINIAPNIGVCVMAGIRYLKLHKNKRFLNKIYQHYRTKFWTFKSIDSEKNIKTIKIYTKFINFINRFIIYCIVFPVIILVTGFPMLVGNFL